MRSVVQSIEAEYRRYKALAEAAMDQLPDAQLNEPGPNGGNPIAVIVRHMAGNLSSRFTDFLTSDGEKPWRQREQEFVPKSPTRRALMDEWDAGWRALFGALDTLSDAQLHETVAIRGETLAVHEALHRSLAHAGYHVGQIVYLAKAFRGANWKNLSIPPGGSDDYNRNPTGEHAADHASTLKRQT